MKTVSKSTLLSIDPKVRPLTQSPSTQTSKQNFSVSSILIRERLNKKHLPLRGGGVVDDIDGYDNSGDQSK